MVKTTAVQALFYVLEISKIPCPQGTLVGLKIPQHDSLFHLHSIKLYCLGFIENANVSFYVCNKVKAVVSLKARYSLQHEF